MLKKEIFILFHLRLLNDISLNKLLYHPNTNVMPRRIFPYFVSGVLLFVFFSHFDNLSFRAVNYTVQEYNTTIELGSRKMRWSVLFSMYIFSHEPEGY